MTNNDELAYREKHSRLWERYDEAAHDNAEHMRDILQLTLDALEAAERHIFKTERDAKALLAERDADKKRIAELEARAVSVKLPKTIWYEHDDLARDVAVLEKRLVKKVLREACAAAGIKLEVEE